MEFNFEPIPAPVEAQFQNRLQEQKPGPCSGASITFLKLFLNVMESTVRSDCTVEPNLCEKQALWPCAPPELLISVVIISTNRHWLAMLGRIRPSATYLTGWLAVCVAVVRLDRSHKR